MKTGSRKKFRDLLNVDKKILCRICDNEFKMPGGAFTKHLSMAHSMTAIDYYKEFVEKNTQCLCGCGEIPAWQPRGGFIKDYISGHNFRGKTKETDEAVARRAKKMIENQNWKDSVFDKDHIPWNLGLTKHTNEVLERMSKNFKSLTKGKTKENNEILRRISETVKEQYRLGLRISPFKLATPEQKRLWRKKATETRVRNGAPISTKHRNFANGFYCTKDKRRFHYQSSWELERMKFYDNSLEVLSWERCVDLIEYHDETGRNRRYNPDFRITYSDNNNVVEEVKGVVSERDILKAAAAKDFYSKKGITYIVLTKKKKKGEFEEISLIEMREMCRESIF